MECAVDRETNSRSAAFLSKLSPRAWAVLELWGLCQTQWNVAGMGGRCGLSYPGVESVAKAIGIPWDENTIRLLQVIEIADMNHAAKKQQAMEAQKEQLRSIGQAGNAPAFKKIGGNR